MELPIIESSGQVELATRQHLFNLLAFLDEKLPDSCEVYNHILTSLWTADSVYKVYFLRNSNGEYGAIVALKKDGRLNQQNQIQRVWLITTWAADEATKLKVYESIEDINWRTDEFVFTSPHNEAHPEIAALFINHGRKLTLHRTDLYYIDRKAALDIELRTPDDIYIKSLEMYHAATVYDCWPYKAVTTVDSVLNSVVESPSAGVFMKDTNQLVSFMTSRVPNGMSQLHTLEGFRRRGYAAYVTRYLSKRMAQAGLTPFAVIFPDNESSIRCFQSVGFKIRSPSYIFAIEYPNS